MATGVAEPLPPSTPTAPTYSYPPVIIILTIVLLIFFFAGFFSIYFCRCFMQNLLCTWHLRRNTAAAPAGGAAMSASGTGLDPSIVESFPSFTYSTVKDYTKERYGLECAICLVEFRSIDVLRLLTTCCHVFHQECIDLWLESHRTCPVCRRNLNSPLQSPVKSPRPSSHAPAPTAVDEAAGRESCSITIDHDETRHEDDHPSRDRDRDGEKGEEGPSAAATTTEGDLAQNERDKFSRSHSTGHSMARNRGGEERFTLILPEEVKSRIMRGHHSSKSWTSFGEYNRDKSNPKNDSSVPEASGVAAGDDKV